MPDKSEWQYLVICFEGGQEINTEKRLSNLGSEGWELVAVGVQHTSHVAYLKRRRY